MENILIQLMEAHLKEVWGERDENRRLSALKNLYTKDSSLFEIHEIITGHQAINEHVSKIVGGMPPAFVFTPQKPIVINNNIGRLFWGVGPEGAAPVATGMDLAIFEDGKIKSLYVFLDK